jgi:hypothetical protein
MTERWIFSKRFREAAKAWREYRAVAQVPDEQAPTLFQAGFSMGVTAAQRGALAGDMLLLEADFLDDLGEHDEAAAVRARIPLLTEADPAKPPLNSH